MAKGRVLQSKTITVYNDPDPHSPNHAYVITGQQGDAQIILSRVIFTFLVDGDQLAWTVQYDHYNVTWGPGSRGANLYIDLVTAEGGIVPGDQIATVIDHGHCTFGGAERANDRNMANGFPIEDIFSLVATIGLRHDVIDYNVGPCSA